jgi:hypothetical protein
MKLRSIAGVTRELPPDSASTSGTDGKLFRRKKAGGFKAVDELLASQVPLDDQQQVVTRWQDRRLLLALASNLAMALDLFAQCS